MKAKPLKFKKKNTGFTEFNRFHGNGRFSRKKANFTENVTAVKSWIRLVPTYQPVQQENLDTACEPVQQENLNTACEPVQQENLAMLSSESSSDECLPHKQLTRLTWGTEGLSNCESESSVAFEVPDYIESSESELEDSEHASEPQLTLEEKLHGNVSTTLLALLWMISLWFW